jgi:hypothetical protein
MTNACWVIEDSIAQKLSNVVYIAAFGLLLIEN